MGAILAITTPAATQATTAQDRACRVFNVDLVRRLKTMNTACRALRAMGYVVTDQALRPTPSHRPQVSIGRQDAPSIRSLLDRSHGVTWRLEGGVRRGFTEFYGATVTWEEA